MNNRAQGFSLIEVLIALSLLMLLLIGVSKAELMSFSITNENYLMSVAENQAQILKIQRCQLLSNQLNEGRVAKWREESKTLLPQSEINITSNRIDISWSHKGHALSTPIDC